jgi:replication-associated recombination protein RarA
MKQTLFSGMLWEVPPGKTIRLKSFTGDEWYTVSLDNKTCTCAKFLTTHELCKHLNALGIYSRQRPFVARSHPTFSQALSGMVKSIRLRRPEEAIYWLVYLDTFKEPQHRFRTARRILIGSAEDGHSIPVMEHVVGSFKRIGKVQAHVEELATEFCGFVRC